MGSSSPPNLDSSVPENTTNTCNPHPLQCPRCNSSNTKFCYFNNYSQSQPRHLCKACKRYWTRGGTLRNVPVGGGCRKNKRTKRPTTKIDLPPQALARDRNINSSTINPVNFPFPSLRSTRVCGDHNNTGFDLGLGFSCGIMAAAANDSGFFYGSSTSSDFAPSSTMASLLASKIEGDDQERFGWNPDPNPNTYHDQINYCYSDPSSFVDAWFDPTNSNMIGSSVPSLI